MQTSHVCQSETLAEIAESAATGSVGRLYAEIRAALGVDLVNLVYRHLATEPGALEWAWGNLGPHFRSGEIDVQAAKLRECVLRGIEAWSGAFDFTSGSSSDLASAASLAHVYNLNNSRNLMAFRHLLNEASALPACGSSASRGNRTATPAQARDALPLPAIPAWEAMRSADREAVLRLNRLGEAREPGIVASLYRHLALWPELLGDVESALVQIDRRGEIARALAFTADTSRAIALAYPLAMEASAPSAVNAALRARLRAFVDITIPKMVPVGLALEEAMEKHLEGGAGLFASASTQHF